MVAAALPNSLGNPRTIRRKMTVNQLGKAETQLTNLDARPKKSGPKAKFKTSSIT